jgi:hypothetical protein
MNQIQRFLLTGFDDSDLRPLKGFQQTEQPKIKIDKFKIKIQVPKMKIFGNKVIRTLKNQ